jgi:transposase
MERHGYQKPLELMQSLPGIGEISAAALLAETGPDMSVFPMASQLSSWIGVCPGNRISAGKNRSTAIPRGNRWARTALVECAWAAAAKKDCYLRERFQRLCAKKGRKPALIAVAQRLIRHHVRRLGKLGVAVHSLRPESPTHYQTAAGTRTQHVHRIPGSEV